MWREGDALHFAYWFYVATARVPRRPESAGGGGRRRGAPVKVGGDYVLTSRGGFRDWFLNNHLGGP